MTCSGRAREEPEGSGAPAPHGLPFTSTATNIGGRPARWRSAYAGEDPSPLPGVSDHRIQSADPAGNSASMNALLHPTPTMMDAGVAGIQGMGETHASFS